MGIIKAILLVLLVSGANALWIHTNSAYAEEILYEDNQIVVKYSGVYSKRTGNPLQFRQSPNWEEEDFFTQQSKYCEVGGKENVQRKSNGSL